MFSVSVLQARTNRGSQPPPGEPERWEQGVPVVDGFGVERGLIPKEMFNADPQVHLGDRWSAYPVRDRLPAGKVVGYLVTGNVGFVDVRTARDHAKLAALDACYERHHRQERLDDRCVALLGEQGVTATGRG